MLCEIKTQIKNKYFLFYIVAIVLVLITWSWNFPVTIKVLSIFLFVISQFVYAIKIKIDDFFIKLLNWIISIVFLLFAISYLALSVKDIEIGITTFLIAPFVFYICLCIWHLSGLWKSKRIPDLILYYVFLAFIVIVLFGYSFAFLNAIEGVGVKWVSENTAVTDTWDFIYFSAQIFYLNNFGDIVPLGFSRLLAVVELVLSTIIHIIVLGAIISRLSEKKRENFEKAPKT